LAIKDILVFLSDGETNEARERTAISMALQHGARLTGAALATLRPRHAPDEGVRANARMGDRMARRLVEAFNDRGAAAGLNTSTMMIKGDGPTSAMKFAHYARNSDLVILAQPNPSYTSFTRLQELAQTVLLHSGRPVFFMPYIGVKRIPYEKALVAWDGTPAASRVVHDAIPLLAASRETIILVVESQKQKAVKQDVLVEGLQTHLERHGVNASIRRVNPGANSVPAAILNQISENDIDLMVMGGYGTPTLMQKVFGSVSQTLLSSMVVPIVMSH
jgi:nucleotide-binding universal stress UspA family protein